MGGLAKITATLQGGEVHHLKALHTLAYGARRPEQVGIVAALAADWQDVGFDAEASPDIVTEMWEKWVLIAALAGSTCLMRAALCDIVAEPLGESLIVMMIGEAAAIATAAGHPPRPGPLGFVRELLTDRTSTMMASMLRDLEHGHRTEADHILGDLLERGGRANIDAPILSLARLHLNAAARRRERAG
jgi:2-dehydropantoate 2-reductase